MRGRPRLKPASERSSDAGFTLVEVVVAMLLIGGALLTIVTVATSAFAIQNAARQRQAATSIANDIMEQIRALPYEEITKGIRNDESRLQIDPHLALCQKNTYRLVACSEPTTGGLGIVGTGEAIVKRDTQGMSPLDQNSGETTQKGIAYTWHAYITQRIDTQGKIEAVTSPYRITVFVDWVSRGRTYSTLAQSLAWSPDGCLGRNVHPVSGPCVSGSKGVKASVSGPLVKVCFLSGSSCAPGFEAQWQLGVGSLSYTSEQVSEMQVTATALKGPGGSTERVLLVDNNGATTSVPPSLKEDWDYSTSLGYVRFPDATSCTATTCFKDAAGTDWWFSIEDPVVAADAAANFTDATLCSDVLGTPLATVQPCMGYVASGTGFSITANRSGASPFPLITMPSWQVRGELTTSGTTSVLKVSRSSTIKIGKEFTWSVTTTGKNATTTNYVASMISAGPMADYASVSSALQTRASADGCASVGGGFCAGATRISGGTFGTSPYCGLLDVGPTAIASGALDFCVAPSLSSTSTVYFLKGTATSATQTTEVGMGQTTGPSFVVEYRISKCSNTSNSGGAHCTTEGAVQLPSVRIEISFPMIQVLGTTVDW